MPHRVLLAFAFALSASWAFAQNDDTDRPKLYDGPALTQVQKDQRESLYKFAYGLLCEKEDRMLEAMTAFEEAARLDPKAPGVFRAQVPLLLMLDRPRDALTTIQRVLELDDSDHDSWFLAARLHKGLGELKEYRHALEKGLSLPGLIREQPQLAQQLYFDLGQYLESTGALAEAVVKYAESAKILDHPDAILDHGPFLRDSIITKSSETYEKIGDLYRKLKNYPAAVKAYQTAQIRQPDGAGRINLNLARVYQEQNAPAEALAAVDAYLRLMPQGTEAYQLKIDLLTQLKRSKEILPWLEKTSVVDRHNVNLKLMLARQFAAEKKIVQADDVFQSLADDSPSDDVYRGLFRLQRPEAGRFILSQFDKAIRLASKKPPEAGSLRAGEQARAMIAVFREDAPIARQLLDAAHQPDQAEKDLYYETRFFLAILSDKHGRLGQAEAFYRRALEAQGQVNEAPLYAGLMRILWKARKFEDIVRVCDDGIKNAQFTNPLLFYNDLAKAHARLGDFRKAEAAAQKAIDTAGDRDRLFAFHLQIRILTQAEKFAVAEAACKKFLEESTAPGDRLEVRYLLSNVYSAWKKLELCEAQLLEVLKNDPTNATANNDLGYIWADHNKNLKEAEEMVRKAIELDRRQRKLAAVEDQDNAAYVDSLGWVLFRRGDFDGAMKELERAVSLPDGDDPTLWDHLGDVYARMGRLVKAQSAYERSIQLYEEERARPKDERYRDVRRKLDQVKTQVRAK
jgi:tetratricopeptide (TPR) repeat protein